MKNYLIRFIVCLCVLCINVPLYATPLANRDFIICIDPGHQAQGDSKLEPIAPGSSQKKARVSSGTSGVGTKKAEYIINLEAARILQALLQEKGYQVVMTRESHDVNISNAERAEYGNQVNADVVIRLHCDSISNGSKTGATLLVPSKTSRYTQAIYQQSYCFARYLEEQLKTDGIKVNGIFERDDMTGFNWSRVPVVIFEMGFMSNWQEDRMLADPNYQERLMQAVVRAIEAYQHTPKKDESSQ